MWLQRISSFQENQASYDSRFCCVSMSYIDVYSGKVWSIFITYVETVFLKKNTKAIVHGFVKNGVSK